MFRGYTYGRNNHARSSYYCSQRNTGCKGRIKLDVNGRIVGGVMNHFHSPPNYMKTALEEDSKDQDSEIRYEKYAGGCRWSTIWFYYDKLDDKCICKICGITMRYNTIRHLQRVHPVAYKEWQNKRREINTRSKGLNSDAGITPSSSKPEGGIKRSSIWLFFKYTNGKATCNICGFTMKNNKIRHLMKKHPAAYVKWHDMRMKNNEYPWLTEASNSDVKNTYQRNRSAIWLFYNKVNGNAVCKTCGASMKDNTIRHLQKKHPVVYKKWLSIRKENSEFPWMAKVNLSKADYARSIWVRYIRKIGVNKYRCELCYTFLKMYGNDYGNVKRHIRVKHPYIYEQEMKKYREVGEKKFSEIEKCTEDVEYEVEYIDNDPLIDDGDIIYDTSKSKTKYVKDNDVNPISCQIYNEAEKNEKDEELTNTDDSDNTDDNLQLSEILRDNDPLLEDKIEELCKKHRVLKRQRNKTCFWNFFDVLDDGRLHRCLFCGKNVAIYPKNISNLKRHLENKHMWQYNLILKYAPEDDSCKTRSKQTKRSHSDSASNADIDFLDRDRFKCKICEEMVICGDDKKVLFDHFVEEHPESVVKDDSLDSLNAGSEYKVIIDADEDSFVIEM